MRDLAIAYRVYPGVSKVPAFHAKNKLELTRFCLQSFHRALGSLSFKIWAILDGCPPDYAMLFRTVFDSSDLEIIETNSVGNLGTFSKQIDLLLHQRDADLVYFAEDDYFYRPNALAEMVQFARAREDVDFVTPYDHPDSYNTSSRHERHRVVAEGGRHWREASSTCLTFLATSRALRECEAILRSYSEGNMDCSLWLALTQKHELFDLRVHAADRVRIKIWAKAWLWGWKNIVSRRSYHLWSPMPTLSTHMEATGLAPLVPWQNVFREAEDLEILSQ